MKKSAKTQTLLLTAVNAVVRFLGMLMRILFSRWMGPEIMGITELSQSVHMLAITPLTSGLPLAVSRMTAKSARADREKPLMAGVFLVRVASAALIPALLLFSPILSRIIGDMRVMPSLWFTAPCILILGYSAVYNGFCYGTEQSWLPAWSELIEQFSKLVIAMGILLCFQHLTAPWMAAVPVFATMASEILGLIFVIGMLKIPVRMDFPLKTWTQPIMQLALPTTLTRLVTTLLRALESIVLPMRLQVSGLSQSEALSRLGMLNGMVMPLMMLPCVFTSALTMVLVPRLAKAENNRREALRLMGLCFLACAAAGFGSYTLLVVLAPLFANFFYRLPELADWIRYAAPLAVLFSFSHVTGGMLASLGQQKRSMLGAVPISCLTLLLTWLLSANPALRQKGVIIAEGAGQIALLLWNMLMLLLWRRDRQRQIL